MDNIESSKLKKCNSCDNLVSKNARICLNCGEPLKSSKIKKNILNIIMGLLVLTFVFSIYKTYKYDEYHKEILVTNAKHDKMLESTREDYNNAFLMDSENKYRKSLINQTQSLISDLKIQINRNKSIVKYSQSKRFFYMALTLAVFLALLISIYLVKKAARQRLTPD